jgi:hypothetical protein
MDFAHHLLVQMLVLYLEEEMLMQSLQMLLQMPKKLWKLHLIFAEFQSLLTVEPIDDSYHLSER